MTTITAPVAPNVRQSLHEPGVALFHLAVAWLRAQEASANLHSVTGDLDHPLVVAVDGVASEVWGLLWDRTGSDHDLRTAVIARARAHLGDMP